MAMTTLGILGSGAGSNMQAILDAIAAGRLAARIGIVLSDNPDAFILERARAHGIRAEVMDCGGHRMRFPEEAQEETARKLREAGVAPILTANTQDKVIPVKDKEDLNRVAPVV